MDEFAFYGSEPDLLVYWWLDGGAGQVSTDMTPFTNNRARFGRVKRCRRATGDWMVRISFTLRVPPHEVKG